MRSELASLAARLIGVGEKLGADEVEVYVVSDEERGLSFLDRVESTGSSSFAGLGVRVVLGKRIGLSSTTALTVRSAEEAVRRACSMARVSEPLQDWVSLPVRSGRASVLGVFDGEAAHLPPEKLAGAALQMLETVHSRRGCLSVTRGEISVGVKRTLVVNSHGCDVEREASHVSAHVSVKAEDGVKKGLFSESCQSHGWGEVDFVKLSEFAAEGALRAMEAKRIPGGSMPVVWRNKLFASVVRVMFGVTLTAEAVQKRRSPWWDKVGRAIACGGISLVDDGLMPRGMGTREFDDEGLPQRLTTLVEGGVLRGFLYDTYTGNKDGVESTGNASRVYSHSPRPMPNNLVLVPGRVGFEEIVEETRLGVFVEDAIGVWLSNAISGDFSATVTNGCLIEGGVLTQPVKGLLVSGNFFEVLRDGVDFVGGDLDHDGNSYSPSVRVSGLRLSSA